MNDAINLYDNLSDDQKAAFNLYKSNSDFEGKPFCYELNRKLRDGEGLIGEWSRYSQLLDSIINIPCKEEILVFRACFAHDIAKFMNGSEFIDPAFMSTTEDEREVQRHFSTSFSKITPVYLEITIPKGEFIFPMEGKASFGGHEKEIFLPRNSKFSVLSDVEINKDSDEYNSILGFYGKNFSSLRKMSLDVSDNNLTQT